MVRHLPTRATLLAAALALALGPWAAVAETTPKSSAKPAQPDSTLGAYLAGNHAMARHDRGAAADFLLKALKQDPDNEPLQRRVMWMLIGAGRAAEAVPLAAKLAARDNETPIAAILWGLERARAGDFAGAAERMAKAPQNNLGKFLMPLLLGWVEAGTGKTDKALETMKGAGERGGNAVLRDLHTGMVLELAGRMDEAEKVYAQTVIAMPRMPLRMVEVIAAFFERRGKPDEAQSLYRDYAQENPESYYGEMLVKRAKEGRKAPPVATNAREGLAEALFHFGSALQQDRSADIALVLGRLALYLKPDLPVAQVMVANILEAQQRYEEANQVYQSISPKSWLTWSSRLRVAANLEALEKTAEAEAMLRAMAKEMPERTDALIQLGGLMRTKERFTDAVAVYDDAAKRVAKVEQRHWTLFYARGIALERSKQWPRAEADFLRALELQPDQPYVLNYLGYSWVDQGINLDRGMDMIRKAVEQRPTDGYIVDSLGWAHYRLKNYEKAVEHLERAVELRPVDPTINDHLGDAYWQVGRRLEARFQWQRAQGLKPEPDLAAQIVKKLREGLTAAAPSQGGG
jgi:tetratricopeptide (TPR) repeat protein